MGAGDGGYVVYRARTEPDTFAIAIDASADALVDGAWKAKRGNLANIAFLVESAERLPRELAGIADEVTVTLPWGSLLRSLVAADAALLGSLAMLFKAGGELRALLSATARDGYAEVAAETLRGLAPAYAAHGLRLVEARAASPADVAASRSAWAKRLGPRPIVFARYRREVRR